jgi:hypothetical protein
MMRVYDTVPDFIKIYGDGDANTGRVVKAYNAISRTGGKFTNSLKYIN